MDEYVQIIRAIREDARKRPPVVRLTALTCPDAGVQFDAHDETNETLSG